MKVLVLPRLGPLVPYNVHYNPGGGFLFLGTLGTYAAPSPRMLRRLVPLGGRCAQLRPAVGRGGAALGVTRRWNQQATADSHLFSPADSMRRALLYRSKQRGV